MTTATIRPNAAGNYAYCSQYPASGSNYDKCDEESSDGDTTYVYVDAATSDSWDTYNYPDGPNTGIINSVVLHMMCRYAGSPTSPQAQTELRTENTNYAGGWNIVTSSYAEYTKTYATNPNTGLAWTWAEITAIQFGPRLYFVSGTSSSVRCTQVWIVIDYTVIAAPTVTTQAATSLGLD
jgi:hypothetical protein